ncbi:hypothetical protein ABZ635_19180 [Nocardiopsis sp. NPDC007018]|uniref:hypothetical protein n=1 Tax=Nocardiopsis sp. NPDC007018 TaxID=3155721 RepID=UPI00340DDDC4
MTQRVEHDPSREEDTIVALLESTTGDLSGPEVVRVFDEALDRLVTLWAYHRRDGGQWSPGFVERVRELVRSDANRHGFQAYVGQCEAFALRSMGDGFQRSCYLRSHIQVLVEEFVPFADLMHAADSGALDAIDELYVEDAHGIPPIPPDQLPTWVPASHWWWRASTRVDMSRQEIDEKLHDYSLSDLYSENEELPGDLSR